MEKDDLDHFLLFAAAVKTITARSLIVPRIHRAKRQLRAALLGFLKVFILLSQLSHLLIN